MSSRKETQQQQTERRAQQRQQQQQTQQGQHTAMLTATKRVSGAASFIIKTHLGELSRLCQLILVVQKLLYGCIWPQVLVVDDGGRADVDVCPEVPRRILLVAITANDSGFGLHVPACAFSLPPLLPGGEDGSGKLSKKQRKLLHRLKIAELKQQCARPDVVEVWDVTAPDPNTLVTLKVGHA
jgi:hypothetical protein